MSNKELVDVLTAVETNIDNLIIRKGIIENYCEATECLRLAQTFREPPEEYENEEPISQKTFLQLHGDLYDFIAHLDGGETAKDISHKLARLYAMGSRAIGALQIIADNTRVGEELLAKANFELEDLLKENHIAEVEELLNN